MKSGEVVELKFTIKANDNKKEVNVLAGDNNNLSEADKITVTLASDNNNLSKVDKIPLTGGINSSLIALIGILLVVSGGLLIFKINNRKKITSIFIICTLSGGLVLGNITPVNAETINLNIIKDKTIKIAEKAYTINVETTASYESNEDEIVVKAERFLNNVILKWNFNNGTTYKVERGLTLDSLEIIEEEVKEELFTDVLESNEQNAYYRVSAYKDGKVVNKSAIIEIIGAKDSDNDGVSDEEELKYGTDINNSDTDADGLGDYVEIYSFKTNPLDKDTDDDNLNDYDEIRCGTNPLIKDTDGDGITDDLEDADNDGLTNYEEVTFGSDPTNEDSDFDELLDKKEKELGTDPNNLDSDNDGLFDNKEIELATDPLNPDSNSNGVLDGDEIFNIEKSPEGEDVDENVIPTINIPLKAAQVDTFEMKKISEDDMFLSNDIPGYIGSGYDFTVNGTFDSASLTYEFNTELLNKQDFAPRIYYFNEEKQILEELENQIIDGNKVTATITHFSKYILLNKIEFDKVWESEIKPPSSYGNADTSKLDIALVIDSSGSMWGNDMSGLRITTSKLFVDKLQENDRASVVDFDSTADLITGFTSDKDLLKTSLDKIDDNGGTNIYEGIKTALDEFDNNGRDSVRNMIVLTDGQDSRSHDYDSILKRAKDNNIIVYTIGLGSSVDIGLLNNIATTTGGKYYHASLAGDLVAEFDKITGETIDFVTDTDKDGISDYYEKYINDGKLTLGTGKSIKCGLNINNADTDGDGLLDGEELVITEIGNKVYVKYISDPTKKDTDDDGYNDNNENKSGTNPLLWDVSDRDLAMLSDIVYNDLPKGTILDSTLLSDKIYNDINNRLGGPAKVEELNGWEVLDTHYSYVGLEAAVYKKDNNLIVGYRGSESNDLFDLVSDWVVADIIGWVTGFNVQVPAAKSFIAKVMKENPGYNIYVTGHSLGGSLAMNSASKAISIDKDRFKRLSTFNGLGLVVGVTFGIFDVGDEVNLLKAEEKIYNHRVKGDIVSKLPLTFHYGTTVEINISDGIEDGIGGKHSIYSFLKQYEPFFRPID